MYYTLFLEFDLYMIIMILASMFRTLNSPIAMHSTAPTGTGLTSRLEVLGDLRGQSIRVNGLESAFSAWPFKVNRHIDQVRKDVTTRLNRCVNQLLDWRLRSGCLATGIHNSINPDERNSLFPHHPKLRKLNAGDYGLFGATWWPCASLTRLRIATFLSIWVR